MKKAISLTVVFTLAITGVSYCSSSPAWAESIDEVMAPVESAAPIIETPPAYVELKLPEDDISASFRKEPDDQCIRPVRHIEQKASLERSVGENELPCLNLSAAIVLDEIAPIEVESDPVEDVPIEPSSFNDEIPLSNEEQDLLIAACEEFGVPYALALALIEEETDFRNMIGDGGASAGYMQIQQRWHYDRMDRLGVTDLLDPNSNFRVGLDYLSELYGTYGDWNTALTVYNRGHNPGYISDYAVNVMGNYAYWQELTENYV